MAITIVLVVGLETITATLQDDTTTGPRITSWEEILETDIAIKSVPTKSTPTIEDEIWTSTPRKIIIECYITETQKTNLETIRNNQDTSNIPSLQSAPSYNVWIENIDAEWNGDKNWLQPWKVRIELTVKS